MWLAELRSFLTAITRKEVTTGVTSMSIGRRLRCQRDVPVVSRARHADGMVHATTGREQLPTRFGTEVQTDGQGMADMGSPKDGTLCPSSSQRSLE